MVIVYTSGTGLLLGLYVFAPFNFVSSPGDQRDVMGHYDTFFCDAIRLDSSSRFDAYLLGKSPSILQSNRSYNTFELNNITMKPVHLRRGTFTSWKALLFSLRFAMPEEWFFMMRGTSNYNKWKKDSNRLWMFHGTYIINSLFTRVCESKFW